MIRVGVVEDDPASIDRILSHLDRFQREHGQRFHVGAFQDGADIIEDYRPDWDILFMDIQMERVDGMTAAKRIREVDSEVVLIFVTSAPQFAIHGYEVGALSYLLKPVSWASFEPELERSIARLNARERRNLLFTTTDGARRRVDLSEVLYLESVRHHVLIHTPSEDFTVVATLKAMEAELVGEGFFRCNSGFLVNFRHVTGVEGNDCRVRGGIRVPISRPRKKDFLSALTAYVSARGIAT